MAETSVVEGAILVVAAASAEVWTGKISILLFRASGSTVGSSTLHVASHFELSEMSGVKSRSHATV